MFSSVIISSRPTLRKSQFCQYVILFEWENDEKLTLVRIAGYVIPILLIETIWLALIGSADRAAEIMNFVRFLQWRPKRCPVTIIVIPFQLCLIPAVRTGPISQVIPRTEEVLVSFRSVRAGVVPWNQRSELNSFITFITFSFTIIQGKGTALS